MDPFIKTRVGRDFWFEAPSVAAVTLWDVAHATSQICRFNGHTREFFSVAQHQCECAKLTYCRTGNVEASLVCLMHDGHEIFVHDVSSPFKLVLGNSYRKMEAGAAAIVQSAFGLGELVIKHREVMRKADLEMFWSDAIRWGMDGVELRDGEEFLIDRTWVPKDFVPHFPDAIPLPPKEARAEFLRLFKFFEGPKYVRHESVYRGINKANYFNDPVFLDDPLRVAV